MSRLYINFPTRKFGKDNSASTFISLPAIEATLDFAAENAISDFVPAKLAAWFASEPQKIERD